MQTFFAVALLAMSAASGGHVGHSRDVVYRYASDVVVAGKQEWSDDPRLLYANGTFISQAAGGGPAGIDPLSVEGVLDGFTGANCLDGSARLADDFIVPEAGWNIEQINVFGYQFQSIPSGTVSPFVTATLRVWDGPPSVAGSSVVFGDTMANRQTGTGWSGVWRVHVLWQSNLQRPIMRVEMSDLDLTLPPGRYWLDFAIAPMPSGNAGCPPNTTVSSLNNALRLSLADGVWVPLLGGPNARPLDLPFEIFGTQSAAPATPPALSFVPAPNSTITGVGGQAVASTASFAIAALVAAAGAGVGDEATTTLSCVVPGPSFSGFGQVIAVTGDGAVSGSPLTGTCQRGPADVAGTLVCSENRGGSVEQHTWTLVCPAGVPLRSLAVPVGATSLWSLLALLMAFLGFAVLALRRVG